MDRVDAGAGAAGAAINGAGKSKAITFCSENEENEEAVLLWLLLLLRVLL